MKNNNMDWLRRKAAMADPFTYVQKASDKFGNLDVSKQCKWYLKTISAFGVSLAINLREKLINGMKSDYNEARSKWEISIADWLKPYYAEPLFDKILSKSKVTKAELEVALNENS